MKVNTILLASIFYFFSFSAISQNTYHPESTISDVIIYERGAMVTRTIKTDSILEAGRIIIDSLPQNITPKSLQVNSDEAIKIISVKFDVKQERSELPESFAMLQEQITELQDSVQLLNTIVSSIRQEIEVIEDNDDFETEQGVNIDQIAKASELYKSRLRALKIEKFELNLKIRQINSNIRALNLKLQKQNIKTFNNYRAIIKVEKPAAENFSLTLSYFTPSATWYSFYDLRVDKDPSKSVLDHKAFVSQSTGEDWNDVKLTLSNRNPNKRIAPPNMSPYKLQNVRHRSNGQYNNTRPSKGKKKKSNNVNKKLTPIAGFIQGYITDQLGDALIGANVLMKGTTNGTVTDIDGSYVLQTNNSSTLIVSYTGYDSQEIDIRGQSLRNVALSEGTMLDEIVITGLGVSKSKKALGYAVSTIDGSPYSTINGSSKSKKQERKSISIKTQKSLNVSSFEILRPYTIPSDGEEYDVLLKTNSILFDFNYVIYPSLAPTAYLNVGVPEWRDYNLFSGEVNLFLSGQYTGVSKINIAEKSDTLWFSLGEDMGVNVELNPVKEYNKKSFLKNKTIELHTFDIEIKNNKNKSIDIIVMDQVPISTDEDIKVKVLELSKAKHNQDSGFLEWKDELNIGKKKEYRVSYEIKYSNNVSIVNK